MYTGLGLAGRLSRGRIAGAGALLALALTPASAAAADRYVDAETGADSNTACPQANPCDTLAYALDNSSPGDQILVDNGSYPESVTVGGGRSLAFQNFIAGDGTGPAIVDGGADAAVTVPTSGAGHVRGLTVRGDITGIRLNGAAEVDSVVADDPDAIQASGIAAELGSDGSTIHDSTVIDPSPSTGRGRYGISVFAADVEVTGNQVSSMNVGISVIAVDGGVLVAQNEVTGTHSLPGSQGVDFGPWLRRFVAQVKRNWFVPQAAMIMKGHVVITFNIHRNGAITDIEVKKPSHIESFNQAAVNALISSNPTQPLPAEYPSDSAFFTVTFLYNEDPADFR